MELPTIAPPITPKTPGYVHMVEAIAHAAHEMNRGFYASLGDLDTKPWSELEPAHRNGVIAGVKFHLANPEATPEDSHAKRSKMLTALGWTYGSVKSLETKQHPCLVPFDQLTDKQIAKNVMFVKVVRSLARIYSTCIEDLKC